MISQNPTSQVAAFRSMCLLWWDAALRRGVPTVLSPSTSVLSVSRWVTEEWGACSRSCGKLGLQTRGVQCLLPLSNGTHKAMPAKACLGSRPEAKRPCLRVPCPAQWRTGAWSQVRGSRTVGGSTWDRNECGLGRCLRGFLVHHGAGISQKEREQLSGPI